MRVLGVVVAVGCSVVVGTATPPPPAAAATSKAPAPQFPPPAQGTNPDGSPTGGTLYQLQAPITLGLPGAGAQGTLYAQLRGMDINVGALLG